MIEQATNTELEIIQVPTKELDNKLNILLASGDRPDIIQCETETPKGFEELKTTDFRMPDGERHIEFNY